MKKILVFLLAFVAAIAAQAAWPQPKNHGFYKLDFSFTHARRFYGMDSRLYSINGPGTRLSSYTASFFGEYGLTNRLTLVGYVPLVVRNTVNEGVGAITGEVLQRGLENTSFGDLDLAVRYNFLKKGGFVLSGTVLLGLPTGDAKHPDLLFTGDGEFNQTAQLDWGFGASRWYAKGFAGVNHRTKGFSEEFRFLAEGGWWAVRSKFLVAGRLAAVKSFRNGNPEGSGNGLFSNNVEYLSPQVSLTWEHRKTFGISVLAAVPVAGSNALAAPAFSVGVYWKK